VLYVGDPRVLPVPSTDYVDGIAYAVTDAGELDFTDRFFQAETDGDDAVVRALDLVATGSTLRAGRLLAPLGIRYIVIPETDGVASTNDDPLPVANGLAASFQNQLDLGAVYGLPSLRIFANQSWFPVGAQLTGATAEASRLAGDDALVRAELSEATPAMVGLDDGAPGATGPVTPGVLHVAVPFDDRIELSIGASTPVARPGFGLTTAFDIERDGVGTVSYVEDPSRGWWVAAQMVMWVLVLAVAAGARSPFARRRTTAVHDETLIDLDTEPSVGVAGEVLAAWDDAGIGWADEPIEFADDLVAGSQPESRAPDRPIDPGIPALGPPRAPLIVERHVDPTDEPVDLAALVADVDAEFDTVAEADPAPRRPERRPEPDDRIETEPRDRTRTTETRPNPDDGDRS
jgi:hypothetical protein